MSEGIKYKNFFPVLAARDEYIANNGGYTFDDTATNTHDAALIDGDSTVVGNVKVTLQSGTVGTFPIQNLIDKNAHVTKVWLTDKDASITEDTLFLWL